MQLGDFFKSAPFARPVNPKPITFTAVASGNILPGGVPNPRPGQPVAAKITAAFIFLSGEDVTAARVAARQALAERFVKDKFPLPTDDGDYQIELQYQMLQRALREFDPKTRKIGDALFPEPQTMRELVVLQECNRLMRAYNAYVADEHPEDVDDATFREPQSRGPALAGGESR